MLLIRCPFCGGRPEIEFRYGGEAHIARPPDPSAVDDAAWTEFLYMRDNPKGAHAERWRHMHGCGRFFNCLRDTVSDRIAPLSARTAAAGRAHEPAFRTAAGGRIRRDHDAGVQLRRASDYAGFRGRYAGLRLACQ